MVHKFRYPTGVRPLLVEETARRRRIEARFVGMLEAAGFAEVVLPIIDYAEPYAGLADRGAVRQSYRFVDRDGELVAVRSDFTPMVARALAPAIGADDLPLRVFYRGDVIRVEATRLGTNRELFQIGAEILGDGSPEADAEVMRLAASLTRAFGIEPTIVYNDVSIAAEFPDYREALVKKRANEAAPSVVQKLIAGTATLTDVGSPRLDAIATLLGDDPAFVLQLDDIDEAQGYYTGLRFRVYDAKSRTKIAQGGRYDNLYERFGTRAAAVGFTFTIDDLD